MIVVLVLNNIFFCFGIVLFVLYSDFCYNVAVFFIFHFPFLGFSPYESLSAVIAYMLNFFCYSFVFGFVYFYCLIYQSVVVFCFVFRRRSAVQFFVFENFSNFRQVFVMHLNLRVYLFVFVRLRFSPFESLSVFIAYMLNFFCYYFVVEFAYVYCLLTQVQLHFVLCSIVEVLFLYFSILVVFCKCLLCILICECICLFLSVCFLLLRSLFSVAA